MIGHRSSVSTFVSPEKRMNSARLRKYLQRLHNSQPEFVLSSHQCRILVEALQKISQWLSQWEKVALSRPFVQELLTLSSKAMRLLDSCRTVEPSSWLCLVALKLDHEQYFLQLFQAFMEALNGYKQVAQDLPPPSIANEKRCIDEATILISCLDKYRLLSLAALEDRRALIQRLEQHRFLKEDEIKLSQFLLERLQDKEKLAAALQIDPQGIGYGELIGQGTYGAVYDARWMGMDVVVKKFQNQAFLDLELKALQKAGHVNVVQVLGYIPKARGERPCLVMERMMGDLGAFVKRVNEAKMELPLLVIVEILQQIAAGMAYLHEKNIVHRDLKPENVLFDRWPPMSARELNNGPCGFSAKIGDFGDSRTRICDTTEATAKRGTACYRAPEVLCAVENGKTRYSNKVDVYSYGMVCYKLLTGCDPCLSPERAREGDCSELHFPTKVPPAFRFFMERCWQRAPRQRPPFKEILEFLSLFKSIMLNTTLISGHWPPLYFGITRDLLAKLVSCLSKEWLMREASLLDLRLISLEGSECERIDGSLLTDAVASELATVPAGQCLAGNCCWPKLQF